MYVKLHVVSDDHDVSRIDVQSLTTSTCSIVSVVVSFSALDCSALALREISFGVAGGQHLSRLKE